MGRRFTLTEKRTMPRNGHTRTQMRLAYVENMVAEKTKKPLYTEIIEPDENGDPVVTQQRASRKVRRRVAHQTRLRNDGRPRFEQPPRIEIWQRIIQGSLTKDAT